MLCFTCARAEATLMRRPHHSITRDHLSLAQRNGALSQVGKIKPFSLLSLSLSMVYPHAALFLIVVSCSHCARDEALRRPCHNIARHHLSLALEKWRPLPNERKIYFDCFLAPSPEGKNHFDCCFFLFPWYIHTQLSFRLLCLVPTARATRH